MVKKSIHVKRIVSILLAILVVFSFAACKNESQQVSSTGPVSQKASLPRNVEGPYNVIRVVDGDTFIASINGDDVRIRVLCIDTPESVAPEETGKTNTDEGTIASNRAKELLEDNCVYLEYDEEKYDQYDRLLAYVYFEDGTRFEDIMISEGLAKVVYYKPNIKHRDELYKIQDKAKEAKAGFWGTGFYN